MLFGLLFVEFFTYLTMLPYFTPFINEKKSRFWLVGFLDLLRYNEEERGGMPVYICIVRHGETDWNVAGRLQGREDIPLNQKGRMQAEQCALSLRGQKWDKVVSSPLRRAKETAQCIADQLNIAEVEEDIGLIERNYGEAAGLTLAERNARYPDGNYTGMEKWGTLQDRFYQAVLNYAHSCPDQNIILVSHGHAIESLLEKFTAHRAETGTIGLKNACVNLLEYQNDVLRVVFYNKQADEVEIQLQK